jgi:fatty-acyl-CoA synthase
MSETVLPASYSERTVPDVLDAQAARVPDRTALIADSLLEGPETRISYLELRDRAARLSSALAQAGVGHGDRVGILLDNHAGIEAHVSYHAAHRVGAVNVAAARGG